MKPFNVWLFQGDEAMSNHNDPYKEFQTVIIAMIATPFIVYIVAVALMFLLEALAQ